MNQKLIVFTDLDGSLLDHDTYAWQSAEPALEQLATLGFPLVFNSSKTFAEIRQLRDETHNTHPAICENGSVIAIPVGYFEQGQASEHEYTLEYFAKPYEDIVAALHALREQGYRFHGFSDMTVDELCKLTGLSEPAARAAKDRRATEPLLWQEDESRLDLFRADLEAVGFTLTRGGRFFHVMSPVNKGLAVQWLLRRYRENQPSINWRSAGLGDSKNDIEMLRQVDYPVLISNPNTEPPDVADLPNLVTTELSGPRGWNTAVLSIIENLD